MTITFRKMKKMAVVTALGLAGAWSMAAQGATATANLTPSATVSNNCTITGGSLSFGAYDPVSANSSTALDGSGTLSVTCTKSASTTVTLGQGSNAETTSTDTAPLRRLKDAGTNYLTYKLYSDSGRTTQWTNVTAGGLAHTGTGTATSLTVYGSVAGGQNVPAASYSDTVVATITF